MKIILHTFKTFVETVLAISKNEIYFDFPLLTYLAEAVRVLKEEGLLWIEPMEVSKQAV